MLWGCYSDVEFAWNGFPGSDFLAKTLLNIFGHGIIQLISLNLLSFSYLVTNFVQGRDAFLRLAAV